MQNPDLSLAESLAAAPQKLMPIIRRACPYTKGSPGWLAWYSGLQFGLAVAHHIITDEAEARLQ